MKRTLWAVVLTVFVLSSACFGQTKTVDLVHKFKAGDLDKHKLVLSATLSGLPQLPNMPQGPLSMKLSMIVKQKVLGVLSDGSAKIRMNMDSFDISIPGMPKPKLGKIPDTYVIVKVSKYGKILSIESPELKKLNMAGLPAMDVSQYSQLMGQMGYYGTFPRWQLQVGDEWQQDFPIPFGGAKMQVFSKLEAAAVPFGKYTSAKINQTLSGHIDLKQLITQVIGMVGQEVSKQTGQPVPAQVSQALAEIDGSVNISGSTDVYFAPSVGKLLQSGGKAKVTLNMTLPSAAVQQGAPPSLDIVLDVDMQITKV